MRVQVEINYGEETIFVTGAEGLPVPAVGDEVAYHGQDVTTARLIVRSRFFHYEPFAVGGGVLYAALYCEAQSQEREP